MIEMLTGLPGSGKSYYAVTRIVEYLKAGRKVYAVIDVAVSEYWSSLVGKNIEEIESLLIVSRDLEFLESMESGSVVVIDECQRFMRAGSEPDKRLLYFMETHRHLGVDVILITQDYMKILRQVYVLAEMQYKFRKMGFVGLHNKTRVKLYGGVKDDDLIRAFWVSFDKRYFKLYKSYFLDGVSEEKNNKSLIWKSPFLIVAGVSVVGLIWFFGFRPFMGNAVKEVNASSVVSEKLKPAAVKASNSVLESPVNGIARGISEGYVITGTAGSGDDWYVVLADGRMMSVKSLIALAGGGSVSFVNGIPKIQAEGVFYAGMG